MIESLFDPDDIKIEMRKISEWLPVNHVRICSSTPYVGFIKIHTIHTGVAEALQ